MGLAGVSGIAGLAALAVIGGPVVPALARIAEAVGTPIAGAVGHALGTVIKFGWDGALDLVQTGQRIFAVLICCAITWQLAERATWKEVRQGYTLIEKVWAPAPRRK